MPADRRAPGEMASANPAPQGVILPARLVVSLAADQAGAEVPAARSGRMRVVERARAPWRGLIVFPEGDSDEQ